MAPNLIGSRIKWRNQVGRIIGYLGNNKFRVIFAGDVERHLYRKTFEIIKGR